MLARPRQFQAPAAEPLTSLFRYGPMLIVVALAIADSKRLADPDLWGHVRFGQAVLAGGHVPATDPYSYSVPGHPWLNHEWLAEVLMAFAYTHLGILGLKLLKLVCSAATVVLLAAALAETGAPVFWQFAALAVISASVAPEIQFRPQMFTFALFAATVALLARHCYRGRARLWLMFPIMALWANLHGGFIMGLAALGAYATIGLIEDLIRGRSAAQSIWLMLLVPAVSIATLLNPYGFEMWLVVVRALHNSRTGTVILDWWPLLSTLANQWRTMPTATVYIGLSLVLFGAFAVMLVLAPEQGDWPLVGTGCVMIAAAFMAVRNYPMAEIALAAPLVRRVGVVFSGRHIQPERHRAWNSVAMGLAGFAILAGSGFFSPRLMSQYPFPAGAVRYIREHRLRGNLLVSFDWGEYAIWHLYPQNRVFVDGRYDTVYPAPVLDDYLKYHFNLGGADAVLRKYPHDLVLVERKMPALRLMEAQPGWLVIYQDKASVLFARAGRVPDADPHGPIGTGEPSTDFP